MICRFRSQRYKRPSKTEAIRFVVVVAYDALAMRSEVDTQRLEAFSDGGFALAIALLIIEVGVNEEDSSLAHRLAEQWPS